MELGGIPRLRRIRGLSPTTISSSAVAVAWAGVGLRSGKVDHHTDVS
jgi:hypothetical protein